MLCFVKVYSSTEARRKQWLGRVPKKSLHSITLFPDTSLECLGEGTLPCTDISYSVFRPILLYSRLMQPCLDLPWKTTNVSCLRQEIPETLKTGLCTGRKMARGYYNTCTQSSETRFSNDYRSGASRYLGAFIYSSMICKHQLMLCISHGILWGLSKILQSILWTSEQSL